MTEPEKKILDELKSSPFGKVLSLYLEEELSKIDSVKGIKSLEEVYGKQYAIDLVEKLFHFLKRETPKNNNNNQYH